MTKRKKLSGFWKVYLTVLAVLAVGVIIFLIWLSNWLGDYESYQQANVAENVFNEYYRDFDPESYLSKCEVSPSPFENDDAVLAYLTMITKDKEITYEYSSSGRGNLKEYVVKADGEKFASFSLALDDTKSGFLFFKTFYKLNDFRVFIKTGKSVTVEVPEKYTVLINGFELDESYISEAGKVDETATKYLPEGLEPISYNEYKVEGLIATPTVSVKDENGSNVELVNCGENSYKAGITYDEDLKKEYNDWILKGLERYAAYMQHTTNNPVSFNEISVYFDPSSDLYEDIRTSENMFVWDYDSWEYLDEYTGEYIKYDENTFSCVCRFDQRLKQGDKVYDDYFDATLYLRNVNGKFLIYGMSQNSD